MATFSTETGTFISRDSDDRIIAKSDVPPGDHEISDKAELSQTIDITDSIVLSDHFASSQIGSKPDPAETAREKLAKIEVDSQYKSSL